MCKWLRLALFMLALSAWPVHAEIFVEETICAHVPYAEVAVYMTQRYMSAKTNTLVIKEKCTHCHRQKQNFHLRMLDHFLIHFDASMTLQLFFGKRNDRPWDYNVFIVDSAMAFDMLRFHIPNTKQDREFHFLIILTIFPDDERLRVKHMTAIFKSCLQFNVYNAVIMTRIADGSFGFYTYALFGPQHCSQPKVYQCNRFQHGRLENDFLFPPRLLNFYNCSLRVCVHFLHPMLGFNGDAKNAEDLRNLEKLHGIEGDVLKILAKSMNFQAKLSIPKGMSKIGEHMNSSGCFAEANKTDIAIGGFTNAHPLGYIFSASMSYHQSPFVFIVRSGLHFGPMKQLANPYSFWVWVMIAFSILVATWAINLIHVLTHRQMPGNKNARNPNGTITNVVTILMGNPVRYAPYCNAMRLLLISWMLASLVLRNAYQGKLFDILRAARRVPPPRSIADMIEQRYKLYSSSYVNFYPSNLTIIMNSISQRYGFVEQSGERVATFSLLDSLAAYNFYRWNSSRLTFVDEPIFLSRLAIYFRKHSMLRAIFDRRLKLLITSGITSHITKKHVKPRFELLNTKVKSVPRIGNNMLRGLYSIYSMFTGLATILFICELLSRRYGPIKRMLDRLHNIH